MDLVETKKIGQTRARKCSIAKGSISGMGRDYARYPSMIEG